MVLDEDGSFFGSDFSDGSSGGGFREGLIFVDGDAVEFHGEGAVFGDFS